MNEIKVEDIKVGGAFSEDAYIFNDMIFMPKKTHIKDFHIKALEDWKISSVSCEGVFMTADRSSDLESSEDTGNSNALNAATSNNNEKSTDSTVIDTKNNELKAVYFEWVKKLTLFCETIIRANTLNRVALQNMIQDMEAMLLE